jgi:hypothetical protein
LIALPDCVEAGLAIPLPGEATAESGETPHHLAAWGRRWRRVAAMRHHRQGVPLPGCKDNVTGRCWRGPTRPSEGVDTPGHEDVNGQRVPSPLLRLHAPLLTRTPLLAHPDKPGDFPPTARLVHAGAGTGAIRHRQTRQPSPLHRCLTLRGAGLLRINRAARHGRPFPSRPTRPIEGHGLGRHRAGDPAG